MYRILFCLVTPKAPIIRDSYIDNKECIVLIISKENTGKCDFFYRIKYLDQNNVTLDTITVKAVKEVTHCKKYSKPAKFAFVQGIYNVTLIGFVTKVFIRIKCKLLISFMFSSN